ncbi:outer membrane protein [Porphyrobacter sp. ULC335]|uniref:outer membrane protein n=1 Tax=Porphyrobacter sp. ULC335 TaxID=2854260 RepID=UPI00221FC372|nr:porin family protein [Porphyrobacter sp. ULC335]UYV15819.1 porin family protein [Porphyrobacter sp. ULC335]
MKRFSIALALGVSLFAVPAAAQEETSDNGGFAVGVVLGFDAIGVEANNRTESDSGVVTGLTAGYDIVSGKGIIGVEAEVTDTSIGDGVGMDGYLGLRLGYEMDSNDVIYLKGGYTCIEVDEDEELEGIRAGAGFEHNFGGFFGRVEYRYSNYNVSDVLGEGLNGNRHQVMIAAGAKF